MKECRVWDPEGKEYIDMLSAYSWVHDLTPRLPLIPLFLNVGQWTKYAFKLSLQCEAYPNYSIGALSPQDSGSPRRAGTEVNPVLSRIL